MFYAIHLALCSIAVITLSGCGKLHDIASRYFVCMLSINIVLVGLLSDGVYMSWDWYAILVIAEFSIIAAMLGEWHPASAYIAWLSGVAIVLHILAALAWYDYDIFIPFKHSHNFALKVIELMQVVGLFVFSLPRFNQYNKPAGGQTWQAMSQHQ